LWLFAERFGYWVVGYLNEKPIIFQSVPQPTTQLNKKQGDVHENSCGQSIRKIRAAAQAPQPEQEAISRDRRCIHRGEKEK